MKKTIIIIALALMAICSAFAYTWTQTIVLIGYVPAIPAKYEIEYRGQLAEQIVVTKNLVGENVTEDFRLIKTEGNVGSTVTLSATRFFGYDKSVKSDFPFITIDGKMVQASVTLENEEREAIPFSVTWTGTGTGCGEATVTVTTTQN